MRIILLSDGTGNSAAKVWRTNVWRTFESAQLSNPSQVAFYDDGVGTSSFLPLAILGGVFGWGLKRNVIDIYKFLCRNYSGPQDDIFGFGFSRGAFTMRVVMGLALNQGLVPAESESELDTLSRAAYRAYRAERYHNLNPLLPLARWMRDTFLRYFYPRVDYDKTKNRPVKRIRFLGLWDTVAAYGLPIDEMTRGVSRYLFPMELPDHQLDPRVERACQALSLDDERTTFHPELWNEGNEPPLKQIDGKLLTKNERISQVWFAGVHSNVGGGYPDDSLAMVPLYWIMKEAEACGLAFKKSPGADPDTVVHAQSAQDRDGRLYDSRQGLGGYYRYGPRKLADLCNQKNAAARRDRIFVPIPKVHESVLKRIEVGAHSYAPIGFPDNYNVVTESGEILPLGPLTYENPKQAIERSQRQEFIWNLVWWKRVIYFLTVAATTYLVGYPLVTRPTAEDEASTILRPISDFIHIAAAFVPKGFEFWVVNFERDPMSFVLATLSVIVLIVMGLKLEAKITDHMRVLWLRKNTAGPLLPSGGVYALRICPIYQAILRAVKYWIAPFFFAFLFLYLGVVLVTHFTFNFLDAAGLTCTATPEDKLITITKDEKISNRAPHLTYTFQTKSLCQPTGFAVRKGEQYQIKLNTNPFPAPKPGSGSPTLVQEAKDSNNEKCEVLADEDANIVGGYTFNDVHGFWNIVGMALLTPLRRDWFRSWDATLFRIGDTGTEEIFLDPDKKNDKSNYEHTETDRTKRGGEVFLYVNDAIVPLPFLTHAAYKRNRGCITVTITALDK